MVLDQLGGKNTKRTYISLDSVAKPLPPAQILIPFKEANAFVWRRTVTDSIAGTTTGAETDDIRVFSRVNP